MSTSSHGTPDGANEAVTASVLARFALDYAERPDGRLRALYERSKASSWNAATDLPWETPVDQEKMASRNAVARTGLSASALSGSPLERWSDRQWLAFAIETQNWTLSQFLHGEQGGLLVASRLVETVPELDAKFYAAVQVADEARHVEAFARYLTVKLSGYYPVNSHLRAFMYDLLTESRWDMTYLGMQVMIEGLALAGFAFLYQQADEPLLRTLIRYVRADEARHVAYGVEALAETYPQLTAAELAERQEFALESVIRLRERLLRQEVWERMEIPAAAGREVLLRSPWHIAFQRTLFSKIFGNCDKLGLLGYRDQWLRRRLTDFGFWVPPRPS
jgi:hypothetical protein